MYYNPVQPQQYGNQFQQQQLQQLQALQQQQMQPQPQMQMQMQQPMQPQPQGFTIIPVGSIDEVRAKTVDWSGKPSYFLDNGSGKIYCKYLELNGIPKINVYSMDSEEKTESVEYATKEEVNKLKSIIDSFLEGLKGESK